MPKIVKMMMIVSEILIGTDSLLEFLGLCQRECLTFFDKKVCLLKEMN